MRPLSARVYTITLPGVKFLSVFFDLPFAQFDFSKVVTARKSQNYVHDLYVSQFRLLLEESARLSEKVRLAGFQATARQEVLPQRLVFPAGLVSTPYAVGLFWPTSQEVGEAYRRASSGNR